MFAFDDSSQFAVCTVVLLYIVTRLVAGYRSTHDASVTTLAMSYQQELIALIQQLIAAVASHSDITHALCGNQTANADSPDFDVPVLSACYDSAALVN